MKIGIQTWGSEGDIRPFVALARGLSSAGHKVNLLVTSLESKNYEKLTENFSVRYVGDFKSLNQYADMMREMIKSRDFLRQFKFVFEEAFLPYTDDMYEAALELCRDNDLVISHGILYPTGIACEQTRTPRVSVYLAGGTFPSPYIAPIGLPNFGKFFNSLFWKFADLVAGGLVLGSSVKHLCSRAGIKSPKKIIDSPIMISPFLNFVGESPSISPLPRSWDDTHYVCGFFNIDRHEEAWEMPADLQSFLNSGQPPIYMTFGSMTLLDDKVKESAQLMISAAKKAGCRAIIQSRWDEIGGIEESANIYRAQYTPHQHIFPHCAAVVHHGGSGTTQASCLAGCPSIIVEHFLDQIYWGKQLKRLGICPRILHKRSLTAQKLAKALSEISTEMKENARKIGEAMRQENGVKFAVSLIEKFGKKI